MHKGAKVALGGVAAAVLGAVGVGAYNLVDAVTGGNTAAHADAAPVETGPPTAPEVERTARDFLAAWESGDAQKAAGLTDSAEAAAAALAGYHDTAHIEKVTLKQGAATGATVPFAVTAQVTYGKQRSTWTYDSALEVVRGRTSGKPLVGWR
ncbi:NTF2-like N-terminal transpeptidase domain-containing protein, partial [Streptomyces sp. NPDC049577]|uniref:NTF2-like N-terminal transpeptidase domain-containing protein n=1 Tax=Streptomyces sp. NPDC049577 TaxID=3155153 RepID=UPI00343A1EAE